MKNHTKLLAGAVLGLALLSTGSVVAKDWRGSSVKQIVNYADAKVDYSGYEPKANTGTLEGYGKIVPAEGVWSDKDDIELNCKKQTYLGLLISGWQAKSGRWVTTLKEQFVKNPNTSLPTGLTKEDIENSLQTTKELRLIDDCNWNITDVLSRTTRSKKDFGMDKEGYSKPKSIRIIITETGDFQIQPMF